MGREGWLGKGESGRRQGRKRGKDLDIWIFDLAPELLVTPSLSDGGCR